MPSDDSEVYARIIQKLEALQLLDPDSDSFQAIEHILDERLGSLLLEHDPVPERDAQLPASAKTLQSILQTVFKFQEFRSNQLEIILASTTESDVFVTMPTAGGKSLCYQIPAIYLNDKFNMVTVVVSPLLSLIHDQVAALLKLGVYVVKITNETPLRERREILQTLNGSGRKPALVYITPERLSNDDLETQKTLADLNRRHLLARLVFDESHTLSTWDFRIANQQIPSILLEQYSNVPVTALTATASPSDMGKTIKSLGMTNTRRFHQSLNRPNLEYTIKQAPLTDDFVSDIVRWIKVHEYEKQTGIIYCTSVNKCKKLANKLREACYCASKSQCKKLKQRKRHSCITAQEYHAELREKERNRVHTEWQEGRFQIVCATTAFGLGIDKPDVRFVIHRNAPTTIENYFQETGRAGRDGLPAHCLCFYSFRELEQTSISFTLKQNNGDPSQPVRMRDTAIAFADFCEEQHICRRVLLLGHFGEQFNAKDCRSRCDNCANRGNLTSQDFTAEAHPAISLVKSIQGLSSPTERRITVLQCINVLRGMGGKQKEHPLYGAWKHLSRSESFPELIFDQLLSRRALAQYAMVPAGNGKANTPYSNHAGNFGKGGKKKFYSHSYVELGTRAAEFLTGGTTLQVMFPRQGIELATNDLPYHDASEWREILPNGVLFQLTVDQPDEDEPKDEDNQEAVHPSDEELPNEGDMEDLAGVEDGGYESDAEGSEGEAGGESEDVELVCEEHYVGEGGEEVYETEDEDKEEEDGESEGLESDEEHPEDNEMVEDDEEDHLSLKDEEDTSITCVAWSTDIDDDEMDCL